MKISFTKKKLVIFVMGILLVGLTVIGSYFSFIYPKANGLKTAVSNLEIEKQMLSLLDGNNHFIEEVKLEQTTQLQRKLPIDPLMDQLLLDFQRVEALSNTYILSMNVDQTPATNDGVEQPTQEETTGENQEKTIESIEGLNTIKVSLSVRAQTYEELYEFLKEIDLLQRIVSIDSISFIGNNELIMVDDELQSLEFLVSVTTFYSPELEELRDDLPKVIHPKPSEKKNPLNTN